MRTVAFVCKYYLTAKLRWGKSFSRDPARIATVRAARVAPSSGLPTL
jgi:hypothetical protein